MDPSAFSLALGLQMFVLSYSCFGIDWEFSLSIAIGATIAAWLAYRIPKQRKYSTRRDFTRAEFPAAWRVRTLRAKTLEMSKM